MPTATRLNTDMGGWMPETRHYQVAGGYLAVTVANYLTATGTKIFLADQSGGAVSTQAIAEFESGSHTDVLESLGYTVIDTIGDPVPSAPEPVAEEPAPVEIPPEIAAMIEGAQ